MIGWKLYDAGYEKPVRLSPEHAKALKATEVSEPDENRPARNASKAAWQQYAADQGMSEEQASQLTRSELIELYG